MDYDALTAWTGLGTALVAIWALRSESLRHRFSTSIDLVMRLEDQFATERMYRNRRRAACAIRAGSLDDAVNEIDEIIDFFEGVGFLVENGALDKRAAWTCFFSYMYRFCHLVGEYIDRERRRDPTLWQGFIDLYRVLHAIEQKDRHRQWRLKPGTVFTCRKLPRDLNKKDLEQFLIEEASLDVDNA